MGTVSREVPEGITRRGRWAQQDGNKSRPKPSVLYSPSLPRRRPTPLSTSAISTTCEHNRRMSVPRLVHPSEALHAPLREPLTGGEELVGMLGPPGQRPSEPPFGVESLTPADFHG